MSGDRWPKGRCHDCNGWLSLRGQESAGDEACTCEDPTCCACGDACRQDDRIPCGADVVHFACAARYALRALKGRGGGKVLLFASKRGPAFNPKGDSR